MQIVCISSNKSCIFELKYIVLANSLNESRNVGKFNRWDKIKNIISKTIFLKTI